MNSAPTNLSISRRSFVRGALAAGVAGALPRGVSAFADAGAGARYAFLVAVGDYDVKQLHKLKLARNDIVEFEKLLLSAGYKRDNVVVMHDDLKTLSHRRYLPLAANIRRQIKLLCSGLEKDDTLIVAFAGHGVQYKGEDRSYFCPLDVDLHDPQRQRLISFREVYKTLEACPAGRKLLLADACRKDPQSRISRSADGLKLESVTLPQLTKPPQGVVALFSCAEGQEAFEHPDLKHGVFFHHVLESFRGKYDDGDGELTLDELIAAAKSKTKAFARSKLSALQTPRQVGFVDGRWVLRKLNVAPPPPPLVGWKKLFQLSGHRGQVKALAFSPDGARGVSGDQAGVHSQLIAWDLTKGRILGKPIRNGGNHSAAVSPTGTSVAAAFSGQGRSATSINVIDFGTGKSLFESSSDRWHAIAMRFLPTGLVAAGYTDGAVRLFDVNAKREGWRQSHMGQVYDVAVSPDNTHLLSGSHSGDVKMWNVADGGQAGLFDGLNDPGAPVWCVAFSDDGQQVLAAGGSWRDSLEVCVWNVDRRDKPISRLPIRTSVNCAAFSPGGALLLVGEGGGGVTLWDVKTGRLVETFRGHKRPVTSVAFSPDGRRALSGGEDGSVYLWGTAKP